MRLHNRQIKATFWNDPDILQWPRDQRWFYIGLVQLADDSGCLENSPFAFKLNLFPSPVDADIPVDLLELWRDKLIELGKLEPYKVNGKEYLFIVNFHRHQTLDKPTPPSKASIPLPPWVKWEVVIDDKGRTSRRQSRYIIDYGQWPDNGRTCPGPVPVELEPELEPELIIDQEVVVNAREEAEKTSDVKRVSAALEEAGILLPSSVQIEELLYWTGQGMDIEVVEYACKVAALANTRRVDYISGILKNWYSAGVRDKSQAEAEGQKFAEAKSGKGKNHGRASPVDKQPSYTGREPVDEKKKELIRSLYEN